MLSIAALAERVKGLDGWRCRAAAVVAGAASVLALAPFFVWPILWLTLPALVWLTDGAIERGTRNHGGRWYRRPAAAAAEIGWWFGFGYFLAGLFWIGEAFLVDAESLCRPDALCRSADARGSGTVPCGGNGTGGTILAHRHLPCGGARVIAIGDGVAARPHPLGLSVERIGLRPHLSRIAHAKCGRLRHLRADADRGARIRAPACPVERGGRAAGPGVRRLPSPCCRCSSPAWQAISGSHLPPRPWCPE